MAMLFCDLPYQCSCRGQNNICTKKFVILSKNGICDQFRLGNNNFQPISEMNHKTTVQKDKVNIETVNFTTF